jgi:hypothetical protein
MTTPANLLPPLTPEAGRNLLYARECRKLCDDLEAVIAETASDFGTDQAVLVNLLEIRRRLDRAIDLQRRGRAAVAREDAEKASWGIGAYVP